MFRICWNDQPVPTHEFNAVYLLGMAREFTKMNAAHPDGMKRSLLSQEQIAYNE